MDKKLRKQLEQQLALTISYFLKKMNEEAAAKMAKPVKAAAKDLAKKFTKHQIAIAELKAKSEKPAVKVVKAEPAKKAVAAKKVSVKSPEKTKAIPTAKKKVAKKAVKTEKAK
jgi:hypothetical protein